MGDPVRVSEAICFHTENGHVMFVVDRDEFRVQIDGQIITTQPHNVAVDLWGWLERTLFNRTGTNDGYENRPADDTASG